MFHANVTPKGLDGTLRNQACLLNRARADYPHMPSPSDFNTTITARAPKKQSRPGGQFKFIRVAKGATDQDRRRIEQRVNPARRL